MGENKYDHQRCRNEDMEEEMVEDMVEDMVDDIEETWWTK